MGRTKVLQMLCKIIKDKSPLNAEFLDSFKQPLLVLLHPQHYTTDWQPLLYHIFQLYPQALYVFSKKGVMTTYTKIFAHFMYFFYYSGWQK